MGAGGPAVHGTVHKERTMSNKTIFCWNIAPIVHRSSRHSIHLAKFVVFFVELSGSASVSALGISCIGPSRLGPFKQPPIIQMCSSFIGFVSCLQVFKGCQSWVPGHCFEYPAEIDARHKNVCYAVYIRLISMIMHV